jgi:hypothetical protein
MSPNSSSLPRIVVDASVAGAASSIDKQEIPREGIRCRQILEYMENHSQIAVFGRQLNNEWKEHESNFAKSWRTRMISTGKAHFFDDSVDVLLEESIHRSASDVSSIPVMLKDAHLLVLALATDYRVTSLDDRSRRHFAINLQNLFDVMAIAWVNPAIEAEAAIDWLENGAIAESTRQLGQFSFDR